MCFARFSLIQYVRRRKKISGIHHKTFFAACLILKNPACESSLLNAVMIVFSLCEILIQLCNRFLFMDKKNKYDIYEIKRITRIVVA